MKTKSEWLNELRYRILRMICLSPEKNISYYTKKLFITPCTVTKIVHEFEDDKLIKIISSSKNREKIVLILPKGIRIKKIIDELQTEFKKAK